MAYSSKANSLMADYANLRTVPAIMTAVFAVASAFQFGAIVEIDITWLSYVLTAEHAAWVSVGAYAVAFASSETKSFEHYEGWEQIGIVAGPILVLGWQYTTQVPDAINALGDPLGAQVAFVVTLVSWGIIAR